MVPPVSGTSIILRRAASTALRTASLTSFAFPVATPTLPWPSPTATSALKPNRRPPLTTLATRLIEMTFSMRPSPSRWRSPPSRRSPPRPRPRHPPHPPRARRAPRAPRAPLPLHRRGRRRVAALRRAPRRPRARARARVCRRRRSPARRVPVARSPSELQSAFARAIGHRLDASVILVAAAVEHDSYDALLLRFAGEELPQREAPRGLPLPLDLDALGRVRRPGERDALRIVHELGVDVLGGAEHDEPGPHGGAGDPLAHPQVPAVTPVLAGPDLVDRSHGYLAAWAVLPALRRTCSPA